MLGCILLCLVAMLIRLDQIVYGEGRTAFGNNGYRALPIDDRSFRMKTDDKKPRPKSGLSSFWGATDQSSTLSCAVFKITLTSASVKVSSKITLYQATFAFGKALRFTVAWSFISFAA